MSTTEIGEIGELAVFPRRTYWHSETQLRSDRYYGSWAEERWTQVPEYDAELVGSLCESGDHAPALDIDMPAELEQLSVPGYTMLTVYHSVKRKPYIELLVTMANVGLVPADHARKLITEMTLARRHPVYPFIVGMEAPGRLLPSSTPDHHHLYIDAEMPWADYKYFLRSLSNAGIIERGFYRASLERKQTMLRKPGVLK